MAYVNSARPAGDGISTSQTQPKPTGTLDGHHVTLWAISDDAAATVTWPSGFNESPATPLTMSSLDAQRFWVATKIANGEPANWTISASSAIKCGAIVHSGRDTVTPIHRYSGKADTTSRGTPWTATSSAYAGGNTAIDGCDLIFLQGDDCSPNGQVTHGTPPSGFTLRQEHVGTEFQQGAVWSKDNVAAGDTGVYSSVSSEAGGVTNLAIVVLALAPGVTTTPLQYNRTCPPLNQRAA